MTQVSKDAQNNEYDKISSLKKTLATLSHANAIAAKMWRFPLLTHGPTASTILSSDCVKQAPCTNAESEVTPHSGHAAATGAAQEHKAASLGLVEHVTPGGRSAYTSCREPRRWA